MTLFFSACFLQKAGCPIFQKAGCPIFKNSGCRLTGRLWLYKILSRFYENRMDGSMIFNQKWTKCANFDKLKILHDLQHTTASKYVQISTYLVQVVICFVSWRCLIQINDLEEVPFDHHFIKKLTRFSCTAVSKKHRIWKAKKNSRKYLQSPI